MVAGSREEKRQNKSESFGSDSIRTENPLQKDGIIPDAWRRERRVRGFKARLTYFHANRLNMKPSGFLVPLSGIFTSLLWAITAPSGVMGME